MTAKFERLTKAAFVLTAVWFCCAAAYATWENTEILSAAGERLHKKSPEEPDGWASLVEKNRIMELERELQSSRQER